MKRKSQTAGSPVPAKAQKTVSRAVRAKKNDGTKKADVAKKNTVKNGPKKKPAPAKKVAQKRAVTATKTPAAKAKKAKPPTKKATVKTKPATKKKITPRKKTPPKKKAKPTQKVAQKKKAASKKKPAKKVAKKSPVKKKGKTKAGLANKKTAGKKNAIKKPTIHPNCKLTPNPAIEVAKKDIMFEEKNSVGSPELSSIGKARSTIKAVITNDMALLKKLIFSPKEVPRVFVARSVDVKEDALGAAMRLNNKAAMELLLTELLGKHGHSFSRMKMGVPSLEKESTGRYNFRSLGHAVRAINVARGGREGNDAFTKDLDSYQDHSYADIGMYTDYAANNIDNWAVIQLLLKHPLHGDSCQDHFMRAIYEFARRGSHKIAGQLAKMAHEDDGHGFNRLHYEVLTCSKPEELTPFRSVSVKKKPYENQKITPLHLAAINPNPNMMLSLLAVVPEFYIQDKNGYGLIHYAAACEGSGPLEALVSRGVFPNQATTMGLTPLMIASKLGRIQNMIYLLKPRKSIPLPGGVKEVRFVDSTKGSMTPLHFAAESGQAQACKVLIEHGANVEAVTSAAHNKVTPVMLASRQGHFKTVKTLVDAKASLDAKDKLKRTPLSHAVMNGNYVIASYLLRKGADPNSRDTSGNTPMHYAAAYGWWHCIKLLLKAGADANAMNDWKIPPLYVAFLKGHTDCADILLEEAGVGVDFRDSEGWTLVMMTVSRPATDEMVKQIKFLVEEKNADVTLQDAEGWNAMHHLASSLFNKRQEEVRRKQFKTVVECARILMDHGCDLSAKTVSGETPVNIAMQHDPVNTEFVQLMLNEGAAISLDAGEDGENILHLLAKKVINGDQSDMFDLLWKQGSSSGGNQLIDLMNVKDNEGFTPLLRLAQVYSENAPCQSSAELFTNVATLVKRFIEKGKADVDYCIEDDHKLAACEDNLVKGSVLFYCVYAFVGGQAATVPHMIGPLRGVLSAKPKLDSINSEGFTPLTKAISFGAQGVEAAKLLISAGADIDLTTSKQELPIILAAQNSLFSLVEILLAEGVAHSSPHSKSNVLHHLAASKSSPVEVKKCLGICLGQGCDINVRDAKKRTPLHLAVEVLTPHSTTDVVDYLLENGANTLTRDEDQRLPLYYAFCKLANPDDSSHVDPIEVVTVLTTSMGGRGVESRDVLGRTPLHYAAYRGATISFTHLVEHITDLNAADSLGNTPLSLAVAGKHDSIAILLIQRGANINVSINKITDDYKRWELMHKPSEEEKNKVWRWEKTIPQVPQRVGSTSLLYSVVEQGWQGVLYLLMDKLERFGLPKTAVIQAVLEAKKWQLALSLIQKKMKNLRGADLLNDKRQNMLHVLALTSKNTGPDDPKGEHLQVATALMSLGNEPTSMDIYGCSALTYAILARDYQLCLLFIEHDKQKARKCLSTVDKQGRPALSAFFYQVFREDVWKLLRDYGLDLDKMYLMPDWPLVCGNPPESLAEQYHTWKPPMVRQTPLMWAVRIRNSWFVNILLKNGADVNGADPADLVTPMMAAVRANEFKVVRLLINPDADRDKKKTNSREERTVGGFGTAVVQDKRKGSAGYSSDFDDDEDDDDGYDEDESMEDEDEDEEEDEENGEKKTADMVKKTTDVDLKRVDKNRRNVFHYLCLGHQSGTYENTAILDLLAQHAPASLLTAPDASGQSPLDLAVDARAEKLVAAMEKLTKQKVRRPNRLTHQWDDGIRWRSPNRYDFRADAEAMLAEINASRSDQARAAKPKAKVDPRVGLATGVEVVEDADQGIPYSVLMTKVDLKYGSWGMNNFYKMQIIYQKGQDMYLLFTCWGRIGDEGQNQRTPFAKAEEAIKEFGKIFAAKSGNQWANVKNFTHHPGKYKLMEVEPHASRKAVKAFNFDLSSNLPSELPDGLQGLLKQLTSIPILNAILKRTGVSAALMPFGQLKSEVISEAKEILVKIRKLNEEVKEDVDNGKLTDQSSAKMNEILELSSQYYLLIPHTNFAFDKVEPLNQPHLLQQAEGNIQNLLELELANRILLGAQYRKKEVNPLDYIYRALGCQIELLEETSSEAQLILQQVEQTRDGETVNVEAIYRLARDNEEDKLHKLKLDNHQLLWHGTRTANLISIMKRGLLTQPVESSALTGNLYGQGIYTSPVVVKSVNYCDNFCDEAPSKFLLLCEAAVGKSETDIEEKGFQPGYNSILGPGCKSPDENFSLRLKSGASIPMGEMVNKRASHIWLSYDEIVLYTEDQVCLRYLVQFRD